MTKFYNYINEMKQIDWNTYAQSNPELQAALKIMKKIESLGYDALIVGGFVRDLLLGLNPHDVDICTNMPVKEIDKYFENIDIGKNRDFGVNVVLMDGHQIEIAQYRADVYSSLESGKGAEEVEIVNDFKSDSSRRDFLLNSLGINIHGEVVDHHGGTDDIKNKKITTVGDPKLRFKEDANRLLRAVRFSSKLGFDIDSDTKETMKKMATDITKVAPERIRQELVKMASQKGTKFADAIIMLDETGILDVILPEITKLKEFEENPKWHPEAYEEGEGRVFDHVLSALRQNDAVDPLINLGILFHDLGKGHGYDGGKHRFFRHAEKSKDLIETIAKRLRLTNKEKDAIIFSAVNHMKLPKALEMKPTKIMKLVNDEHWEVLKAVSLCDDSCRKGLFDKKRFNNIINNMESITRRWGDKVAGKTAKIVDGNYIMKKLNIKPSPLVGKIIEYVTDEIINKGNKESIDKLIFKAYKELK